LEESVALMEEARELESERNGLIEGRLQRQELPCVVQEGVVLAPHSNKCVRL
jgi:hypothetical protein